MLGALTIIYRLGKGDNDDYTGSRLLRVNKCKKKNPACYKWVLVATELLNIAVSRTRCKRDPVNSWYGQLTPSISLTIRIVSGEIVKIRMHFSRMRTARFSGRLFGGYGGLPWGGCLPRGMSVTHPYGQTDACESITLPQTSFASGNKVIVEGLLSFIGMLIRFPLH